MQTTTQVMTQKERFDLVLRMGEALLQNGGEIFRTNELMHNAAGRFGLEQFTAFTIANGIFVSALADGEYYSCQVRHVPLQPIHLGRVEALNQLSRRIAAGELTAEESRAELDAALAVPDAPNWKQILSSGAGSACFCYLFGGSWRDAALAFAAGLLLYLFILKVCAPFHVRKVMTSLAAAALATLFCCCAYRFGLGEQLDKVVIGAIFPLVPGVPLVNAVRNFMENDYIAGLVRLTDAVLVAGCIAVGVGSVMILWSTLFGGVALA